MLFVEVMGKQATFHSLFLAFEKPTASLRIKAMPVSGHRDFREQGLGLFRELIQNHPRRNIPDKGEEREGNGGI